MTKEAVGRAGFLLMDETPLGGNLAICMMYFYYSKRCASALICGRRAFIVVVVVVVVRPKKKIGRTNPTSRQKISSPAGARYVW
jgi:hypothetical protein